MIKRLLKSYARKLGYVIAAHDPAMDPIDVRRSLFRTKKINVVFDVGANSGQYARQLKETGYTGKIVSFEPLSSAFKILEESASKHANWMVQRCALGDKEETAEINISRNSWSSSMLDALEALEQAAPEAIYVDKELISIKTLDSLFSNYVTEGDQVFLKMDTQGYTAKVLEGASESINKIQGIFVEMSLIQLYSGEPLIGDITTMLYKKGFILAFIEPEFIDRKTGQLLQVNGFFIRV